MINQIIILLFRSGIMGRLFDDFVHSYILDPERDTEFFEIVGDLFFTKEIQGMRDYPQHSRANRLDHITGVTYLSYTCAKRKGLDVVAATRGAMLHDLFYYDWHDKDWSHRPHGYRHPGFAVKNARVLNPGITRKEELIILRHMWPLTPMPPASREGMLVSCCDKYCATAEMLIINSKKFKAKFDAALNAAKEKIGNV